MVTVANFNTWLAGRTILVIDDEPDSLEVAQTLLEDYDVNVITADNGRAGLEMASKHMPALIISDISMPEMSGWELVEALKKDRRTIDIPVIALTAHAMAGDRHKAIAAGFHNYLSKPLSPENFVKDLMRIVLDSPQIVEAIQQTLEKKNE
jgi:CheY-like chemotaxis protein